MEGSYIRGKLHIFADDPYKYLSLIQKEIIILITYEEVLQAIEEDKKEIYTTQIYFLSHLWIKAGYDITLYHNNNVVDFNYDYVRYIGANNLPINYYYMQDLFTYGELYEID